MTIDFRKNANVLAHLQSFAKPKERTAADPFVEDGYELHAHPDLVDRLRRFMAYTPEAEFQFAFGIPVLLTKSGRIFATAGGTHYFSLYLPADALWGEPDHHCGPGWRQGPSCAVGRLNTTQDDEAIGALLRSAYVTASKLDG